MGLGRFGRAGGVDMHKMRGKKEAVEEGEMMMYARVAVQRYA